MKNITISIMSVVLILMLILIGATVYGRSARKTELENAMNYSMEKTVEALAEERGIAPESNDEFIAMFVQLFTSQLSAKSDVEIEILSADYTTGLLSVKATEYYTHVNGRPGAVTLTKTIINEAYGNDSYEATVQYSWASYDEKTETTTNLSLTRSMGKNEYFNPPSKAQSDKWKLVKINSNDQTEAEIADADGNAVTMKVGEIYTSAQLETLLLEYPSIYYNWEFQNVN
jgi:hypothetical protein